jgi:hypothetical protein
VDAILKNATHRNGTINAINTISFHPSIVNQRDKEDKVKGDAVSTTSFVVSVILDKLHLGLQRNDECAAGRPISMSAT